MFASPHNFLIRHCLIAMILVFGDAHAKDASEDREAAVYDRAVIATAHAQTHAVAFDPAVISLIRLAAHADQALEGLGVTLEPLRMTSEGDALANAK